MSDKARIHAIISGRVQGVAYRYFVEKWAVTLAVTGWVRNLYDGRVEVLAEGNRASLNQFLEKLRSGPRMALVDDVDVRWEEYTGEFPSFQITFSWG